MVIGVDFDNTLVSYDELFLHLARERGLVTGPGKKAIRDSIRQLPDGEIEWQKLQGIAYGPRMAEAKLIEGVPEFFAACRERGLPVHIISHKTEFAAYDGTHTNLRQAAQTWMNAHGLPAAHFGGSRAEKIAIIQRLGCTVFVDDLEETFLEPDFPSGVEKLLFASHGHEPMTGVRICRSWQEILESILFARLLGRAPGAMEWIGGGGNSRIYKLNGTVAGKVYFQQKRLDVEFAAMQFLWQNGIRCIPRPLAVDPPGKIALYEFIEGTRPVPTAADIDAAVDFLLRLKGLNGDLPPAAEACFSIHEIIVNIEERLARLEPVTPLREFLREFRRLFDQLRRTPDSPAPERTLSPSDFGFHNALRRTDGSLVFLDFEYFGWDDPAKMVSDFLLHPAMELSEDLKRRFWRGIVTNKNLAKRIETVYPLFGLKWVTIMLNEFLPEDLRRRSFAAGHVYDRSAAQVRQLEKARRMIARIQRECENFPYRD